MRERKPPKKRFWQLHLSTAVLMIFLAGGIVGLHFKRHVLYSIPSEKFIYLGWPMPCQFVEAHQLTDNERANIDFYHVPLIDWYEEEGNSSVYMPIAKYAAIDAGFAAVILLTVTVAFEFLLRRREARRT